MIKTVLIILLGVFFLVNGINHFYNSHIVREYAEKRGLFEPKVMVFLSGLLLVFGGLSMITGYFIIEGMIGLCIFMTIAAFTIHSFWKEEDREDKMMEFMNFVKNWAIIFELVYLTTTVESKLGLF
ncbi:DoxX family protein [Gracilimonas tropica]|uniref:DoxX family protein n=1 Tax=Gracilimonas tropica TaxID=454600 RepID=UPI00036B9A68|nr:DoxX family protein [Gracilimonas tropica]